MQIKPSDIPEFAKWRGNIVEDKCSGNKRGWCLLPGECGPVGTACQYCERYDKQPKVDGKKYLEILEPIAGLIAYKNRDYGKSYDMLRDKYGKTSFLIRLADKMNRLENLAGKNLAPLVQDESEERTIEDIIGYCTLELAYRREKNGEH